MIWLIITVTNMMIITFTATLMVGGGTKYECWNPKWISMSFQYIRTGKKEFLNLVTVLTLHIDPQYLKNHYIRVKNQNCRRPMVWPIKTCARGALSQWKRISSIGLTSYDQNPKNSWKFKLNQRLFRWHWNFATLPRNELSLMVCASECSLVQLNSWIRLWKLVSLFRRPWHITLGS